MRKKRMKNEIIIIVISVGLIIASLVYTFSQLNIEVINAKLSNDNMIDLFFTLFEVQATIAVLSISIIAIITGFQSNSIHGISVTHYVTTLKPCILKHRTLMITDLVITAINYFLVSHMLFNISIAVFIISILISCVLICDTSFVFKKHSVIEEEINSFFIKYCDCDYIDDLGSTINEYASAENVSGLKKELSFLHTVFKDKVNEKTQEESILKQIETILRNCFLNSYLSNNKEMVLDILKAINDIYKTANDCENIYPVDIWSSIYLEYLTFIGSISLAQLQNHKKFDYFEFKYHMTKNQVYIKEDGNETPINNVFLEYYYSSIYKYIIVNNGRKDDEFYGIKKGIFQNAYFEIPIEDNNIQSSIMSVKGLCYLIKELIDVGETVLLEKEYLRHEKYHLKDIKSAFIFLVSVVYSYYLSYYEPIVNEKTEQKNAVAFLGRVKESFREMIYYIDLIEVLKYRNEYFYNFMRNWEKYEDRVVKTVCLEPTIRRFLFFLSIEKYIDERSLSTCFRLITNNDVQELLTRYFEDEKVFDNQYKRFQKEVFGRDETPRLDIIKNIVKSALAREYKVELIESSNKSCINSDTIKEYESRLLDCFNRLMDRFSPFNNDAPDTTNKKSYSVFLCSVDEYDFNQDEISEYIEQSILLTIYQKFFSSISPYLNVQEVSYESKDKQDTLISLASGLDVDTYLGNQETFWDENDKDKLIKYCDGFYKIDNPFNFSEMYLLNGKAIYFAISNISFEFEDYNVDSIDELNVEIKDGVYYYGRYSNIPKVPFNKEELFDYLSKKEKRLKFSFEVNYAVKEEKIGCGIDILYDQVSDLDEKRNNKSTSAAPN